MTLEKAGFSYDSTVGYNETIGYRAGTAQVFKHPGRRSFVGTAVAHHGHGDVLSLVHELVR